MSRCDLEGVATNGCHSITDLSMHIACNGASNIASSFPIADTRQAMQICWFLLARFPANF